jgi:hypothetical protein
MGCPAALYIRPKLRASSPISRELRNAPEILGAILQDWGVVFNGLGMYRAVERHLKNLLRKTFSTNDKVTHNKI